MADDAHARERTGRCLCGEVTFRAIPEAHDDGMHVDACHCGMCRRQIGGPLMGVTLEGPPVFNDESRLGVYQSSEWAERVFCRTCGTNLLYRMRNGAMYTIHAGALDDLADARFAVEIFVDDKPDYYAFAGDRLRMTGAEVMAAFAGAALDRPASDA